jgi:hypothetical protein
MALIAKYIQYIYLAISMFSEGCYHEKPEKNVTNDITDHAFPGSTCRCSAGE